MTKLIFIGEKFGGRTYEILAQRTTVGRSEANTLSIHDGSVSELHCEIYDNGADVIVRDLGSRNGTFVNGEHLRDAQRPLAHGQIVKFGAVAARLEISAPAPSSDIATDVTAVHFHAHNKAAPTTRNPTATLDDGLPHDASDQTLLLPRQNPEPTPASPVSPRPESRIRYAWLVVAVLIMIALAWWIFR